MVNHLGDSSAMQNGHRGARHERQDSRGYLIKLDELVTMPKSAGHLVLLLREDLADLSRSS
ncbi:hypothetical protein [Mesorhizobium sp. WSM3873]|uniref:hypothetical protein n=1 Tax=Mesorhizobium sp. WSM3873 TaxID=1854056 RepID=UPI0007FC632C|nr:hypothetical protein [Mesorhizobium sp. WSM3873]OBQ80241.1 hypothetical protein A9K71_05315 [Mesorhizobium sp. WSM3873]